MTAERKEKFNIVEAETVDQIAESQILFREYKTTLDLDLCFPSFEAEIVGLPGKYGPPDGRLYLIVSDGRSAGCVALRKLDEDICEMKRLYVRGEFRGRGLGVELIAKAITAARSIGYRAMRLDTYPPKMGKAVSLYESHGFYQIDPYYDNPTSKTIFMELIL